MGFSQARYYSTLLLHKSYDGVIQVDADDAKDTERRDQVRQHLKRIALIFMNGDFNIPMFVHDQTPAGAFERRGFKSEIGYKFEEIEARRLIS